MILMNECYEPSLNWLVLPDIYGTDDDFFTVVKRLDFMLFYL